MKNTHKQDEAQSPLLFVLGVERIQEQEQAQRAWYKVGDSGKRRVGQEGCCGSRRLKSCLLEGANQQVKDLE